MSKLLEHIEQNKRKLEQSKATMRSFGSATGYFTHLSEKEYGVQVQTTPLDFYLEEVHTIETIIMTKFLLYLHTMTRYKSVNMFHEYEDVVVSELSDHELEMLIFILKKYNIAFKKSKNSIHIAKLNNLEVSCPLLEYSVRDQILDHSMWNVY